MIGDYDLSLKERLRKWRRTEAEKLSRMTFRKKIEYIFAYYKWAFVGILVLALFGWYVGDAVSTAQKEVVLEGFFTNDDYNVFPADTVKKEYAAGLALKKNQTLILDDTLYISLEGDATEYTAASKGKVIAYMAARELDFVVTTRSVLDYYMDGGSVPMLDLNAVLPEDLLTKLSDCLIAGTDSDGSPAYVALDLSGCRYVQASAYKDELPEPYVLFLPYGAPHTEQVVDFLRFLYS